MEAGRIGGKGEATGQGTKVRLPLVGDPHYGRSAKNRSMYEGVNCSIVVPPVGRPGKIPVARKKKRAFRLTRPGLLMEASRTVRFSDQIRHGYDLVLDWKVAPHAASSNVERQKFPVSY